MGKGAPAYSCGAVALGLAGRIDSRRRAAGNERGLRMYSPSAPTVTPSPVSKGYGIAGSNGSAPSVQRTPGADHGHAAAHAGYFDMDVLIAEGLLDQFHPITPPSASRPGPTPHMPVAHDQPEGSVWRASRDPAMHATHYGLAAAPLPPAYVDERVAWATLSQKSPARHTPRPAVHGHASYNAEMAPLMPVQPMWPPTSIGPHNEAGHPLFQGDSQGLMRDRFGERGVPMQVRYAPPRPRAVRANSDFTAHSRVARDVEKTALSEGDNGDEGAATSGVDKSPRDAQKLLDQRRKRRESHNAVERRRRDNINLQITERTYSLLTSRDAAPRSDACRRDHVRLPTHTAHPRREATADPGRLGQIPRTTSRRTARISAPGAPCRKESTNLKTRASPLIRR